MPHVCCSALIKKNILFCRLSVAGRSCRVLTSDFDVSLAEKVSLLFQKFGKDSSLGSESLHWSEICLVTWCGGPAWFHEEMENTWVVSLPQADIQFFLYEMSAKAGKHVFISCWDSKVSKGQLGFG